MWGAGKQHAARTHPTAEGGEHVSLLDLQGMKVLGQTKAPPPGSRTSKGCNNNTGGTTQSNVSLLLCTLTL